MLPKTYHHRDPVMTHTLKEKVADIRTYRHKVLGTRSDKDFTEKRPQELDTSMR